MTRLAISRPGWFARSCAIGLLAIAFLPAARAQLLKQESDPAVLANALLDQQPGVASVAVWRAGGLQQASVFRTDANSPVAAWPEPQPPMFEIGSVSKVFTGLLLAQAVERGELALTDKLGTLLKDQAPGMSPGVAAIDLRQLVTHTSCLPRQVASQGGAQMGREFRDLTRAQLWAGVSAASVAGGPPCAGVYSNFGFAVLGELLAQHAGKPWDALVRERITGPLGMTDTVVRLGERESRMALPFSGEEEAPAWDMEAFAGAGGLRSTAADLVTFARAVAAGRQGPLGPAAERLVTPLAPFEGAEIGYAVWIREADGRRVVWHMGLTGGYRTVWMVLPQGEAVAASVSNAQAPAHKVVNAVDRSLFPVASVALPVNAATLAQYAGVYRYGREGVFGFGVRDGALYVRGGQDGFAPLLAVADSRFTRPESAAQFDFERDAGRVTTVTLRQGGRMVVARRDDAASVYAVASREQLLPFAGRYRLPWGAVMEVTAGDGQLLARLPRQWRLPVFALAAGNDRFAYVAVKAELQFERDAQGRVASLVLHQNGEHRAQRLPD